MPSEAVSFSFGKNWQDYARFISEEGLKAAQESLRKIFGMGDFSGKTFVDVGCGSGLFTLAAHSLGAHRVVAFDYDPMSVACTEELVKNMLTGIPASVSVSHGSALDGSFIRSLGTFDLVYSWGVLHHTGSMWEAVDNASELVAPGGRFAIALYNKAKSSRFWLKAKRLYNKSPSPVKWLMHAGLFTATAGARILRGRNPFHKNYRGMNVWHDSIDWLGGLPYQWASVKETVAHMKTLGFAVEQVWPVAGFQHGCNEFLFVRE